MVRDLPERRFVCVKGPESEREDLRAFAMAAVVLGVPLSPRNSFVIKRRVQGDEVVKNVEWYLEPGDPEKRYKTVDLYRSWRDEQWLKDHPDHPLALMKRLSQALAQAVAHEGTVAEIAVLKRGRRFAFIPDDMEPKRKEKLLEIFNEK